MRNIFRSFNLILGLMISAISFSCFQDSADTSVQKRDSSLRISPTADNENMQLWEYDANGDSMIRHQIPHNLTTERVVNEFNTRYADMIHLDLVRVNQDTVFLKIKDPSYLTQRMGTTGAFSFMTELVYSLTEVPDIQCVNLDFEEGDHASPGLYRRLDFDNKL